MLNPTLQRKRFSAVSRATMTLVLIPKRKMTAAKERSLLLVVGKQAMRQVPFKPMTIKLTVTTTLMMRTKSR